MQRRTEIGWDDALAVELAQNVQIIEISHAGVGGGAGHDGFQLLGQNGFQIVRPNFDGAILQHQLEAVTHLVGRDGVAGGNVDLERRYHTVNSVSMLTPDARILSLVHDLGKCRSPGTPRHVRPPVPKGDDRGDQYFVLSSMPTASHPLRSRQCPWLSGRQGLTMAATSIHL